jgi:hypothetical protein
MGTKLNQIIAVEPSVKTKADRAQTDLYHLVQKPALLSGLSRTYQKKDDDGDDLPSESTQVQVKVDEVTFTKETANASAKADVKVDGNTLLADVPVTYLLFLEKQLVHLATFVSKLPVLDPAVRWTLDTNDGVYKSEPVRTVKTKKVPRNWVKAEATDKHPAQVEVYHEDVVVGTWTKQDFSGAIPATRKQELLERVEKLQAAVKFAREEANSVEVSDRRAAAVVFDYLFA